ncbi:MAG: thiamine-phosphate kinase [Gammaproteobacteria bacterium]|nr:thiamine-phosphate kinase [Gammaproteobacteria bacterium]
MACGEFELIERFFKNRQQQRTDVVLPIGDDCALLAPQAEQLLAVSTDTLVSGVHFFPDIPAHALGYKSLAINLSDLAAMGATPSWVSLAITLPSVDETWLESFSAGFFEAADYFNIQLIGGDVTKGPLSLTLTVQGQVAKGQQLTRSGANVGDWICVTGNLGDSALGLQSLAGTVELSPDDHDKLLKKHYYPTPRLLAGQALRGVATAAIDISDGLAADVGHIAKASGYKAVIDIDSIPLSDALLANTDHELGIKLGLGGGEDYELCFTVPPAALGSLDTLLAHTGVSVHCVGQIHNGSGVEFVKNNKPATIDIKGFSHF